MPPISPIMMIDVGLGIGLEHLQHVDEFGALDRVAADADAVVWPRPIRVVWNTAS